MTRLLNDSIHESDEGDSGEPIVLCRACGEPWPCDPHRVVIAAMEAGNEVLRQHSPERALLNEGGGSGE